MKRLLYATLFCSIVLSACADDDSDYFLVRGETSIYQDDDPDEDESSSSVRSSSSYSSSSYRSSSSSKVVIAVDPCKTESEDNCEYGILEDARDGQTYKTVRIGEQVWMAEDLNYRTSEEMWYEDLDDCILNINGDCVHHGFYYTWVEAIDSIGTYNTYGLKCGYQILCTLPQPIRGICPEGWHLPSYDEFDELYYAMGENYRAMQATGFGLWNNATDSYGFSALPTGYGSDNKPSHEGISLGFWASTGGNRSRVDSWYVHNDGFGHTDDEKDLGYMVRCIQD